MNKDSRCCKVTVDRGLLTIKATYFFLFAALAVLHPFIPVFMKELSFSPTEVAIIFTVTTIGTGVARILVGAIADVFRNHAVVMTICCVIAAIFHGALYITTIIDRKNSSSYPSTNHMNASLLCKDDQFIFCLMDNSSTNVNDSAMFPVTILKENSHSKMSTNCKFQCCFEEVSTSTHNPRREVNSAAQWNINYEGTNYQKNFYSFYDASSSSSSKGVFSTETTSSGQRITLDGISKSTIPPEQCQTFPLNTSHNNFTSSENESKCFSISFKGLNFTNPFDVNECWTTNHVNNCTLNCLNAEEPTAHYGTKFIFFFVIFFVAHFSINPVNSILDSLAYSYLRDKGDQFGKLRLWGTVSMGIFGLLSGLGMDALAAVGVGNADLCPFVLCSAFTLITAVTSYNMPSVKVSASASSSVSVDHEMVSNTNGPTSANASFSLRKNVVRMIKTVIIDIVLITMLISGIILAFHETFFFWFLKTLGASQLTLGICILIACCVEIIVLFMSGRIMRFLGFRACLYLVFFVYAVRFLVNSFITDPWVAITTEATHGVCVGTLWPAASMYIISVAPAGMHGTIQSFISTLHGSIGKAIGTVIAGALFEAVGPRSMYRIISGVSLGYAMILGVTLETLHRRKRTGGKRPTGRDQELEVRLNSTGDVVTNETPF